MSRNTTFFIRNTSLYSFSILVDNLISLEPIAIGTLVPPSGQSLCGIAIGRYAGITNQGLCAIAIGEYAGSYYQGTYSVALGYQAGQSSQHSNSIVLNASGSALNTQTSNALYVAPIRSAPASNALYYDTSTSEIVYSTGPNGSSFYGQFYNPSTIVLTGSPQIISFPSTDYSNNVAIVSGSQIKVSKAGNYQFSYSMQFEDTKAGDTSQVQIYLTRNGTNISNTSDIITVDYNHNRNVFYSNTIIVTFNTITDYIQINVLPTSVNTQITGAVAVPPTPARPSVRLTVISV